MQTDCHTIGLPVVHVGRCIAIPDSPPRVTVRASQTLSKIPVHIPLAYFFPNRKHVRKNHVQWTNGAPASSMSQAGDVQWRFTILCKWGTGFPRPNKLEDVRSSLEVFGCAKLFGKEHLTLHAGKNEWAILLNLIKSRIARVYFLF